MVRVLAVLVAATLATHAALAERRVALVIGNAKYEHAGELTNTVNDAKAIAALLKKAGFDVVDERRDVGVVEFKRAVREFLNSATGADIAVVYYSGHGVEVGGANYLIPVDAKLASDYDMDDESVSLDRILLATQPAKKLSLIILDACRDNPFLRTASHAAATRSIGNRLASVQPPGADTLVAYAAKAGSVSYDGSGANSPFTTALVKYIAEPGLDIRIALGKVRDDVLDSTGNRQEPFVYGSLGGANIWLVPPPEQKMARLPDAGDLNAAIAHEYETTERVGARQAWEAFLAVHSTGFYADLARAQLAKLVAAEAPNAANAKAEADRIAALKREETERNAAADAARSKPEREPAPTPAPPRTEVASVSPTKDQACKRDAGLLASLRANPSAARVAQFARDLACEELRPQVARLAESLGAVPAAPPQATAPSIASPSVADAGCKRDEARLNQLRANPSLEQVTQFAAGLACADLRPQVQRLMESLGASPTPATQSASLAPQPQSRGVAQPAVKAAGQEDDAQTCKRDADDLARIRAHPSREAAVRFADGLKCESLRSQAARLLESVGP
jgi:uncharacterized caspase-like protein